MNFLLLVVMPLLLAGTHLLLVVICSNALATGSDALVTRSFLLLVMPLLLVVMHLLLVVSSGSSNIFLFEAA